ncbi:MAG TPA: hypothetical protein VGH44_04315 [Candidatus Saccharimonadia bacterium]|jgi:hypothetical protein
MTKANAHKLGLMTVVAGLLLVADAQADGTQAVAQPTPCITPPGAIYSVNCAGVNAQGGVLGDNTSEPAASGTPSATPSPSLTPGTMPSPEASATPVSGSGSGSNLPDTGAMTAISGAIGLGAIGYAGRMYWKRRQLANQPVRPQRMQSDPEVLEIAKISV